MSSGTHEQGRSAPRLPDATAAREAIGKWLSGGRFAALYGNGLDFRGVDLSGMYVYEAWLYECDFRLTRLVGTDLPGAHLNEADFRDAELSSIILSNAGADRTDFSGARMDRANLRGVEANGASFRNCILAGSEMSGSVRGADLRGADLEGTRFLRLSLREAALSRAHVAGARGTVLGPFVADVDGEERIVDGVEAEKWFASRGAEVEVLPADAR